MITDQHWRFFPVEKMFSLYWWLALDVHLASKASISCYLTQLAEKKCDWSSLNAIGRRFVQSPFFFNGPATLQAFSMRSFPDGHVNRSQRIKAEAGQRTPPTVALGDRPIIVSPPLQRPRILWGLNKRRWDSALTVKWNIPILYKHYITLPLSRNWQLSTGYEMKELDAVSLSVSAFAFVALQLKTKRADCDRAPRWIDFLQGTRNNSDFEEAVKCLCCPCANSGHL